MNLLRELQPPPIDLVTLVPPHHPLKVLQGLHLDSALVPPLGVGLGVANLPLLPEHVLEVLPADPGAQVSHLDHVFGS